MCGFVGFLGVARCEMGAREFLLRAMLKPLTHRGPDAEGIWLDHEGDVALGHRRLSVVDLSPAGAQPMVSHDGRFVLVYNGEIYNHREIRQALDAHATVAWRGHSDTEVLLEAVSRWGLPAALDRFDGMFAFVLWDRHDRMLHLARDRFGEKPLYYGWMDGSLVFASELKGLRVFPGFAPDIDRSALTEYLRLGYVPSPRSIYRGIHKLPAGSFLSLPRHAMPGSALAPVSYWSAVAVARSARQAPFDGNLAEAADALESLLGDAVSLRMEADVPLGALLSGGIDSSTVVALMQARRGDRVRTFSIGNREPGYDEAGHAQRIARHLGTEHTEFYVEAKDALAVIPRLPTLYDEPFADSSQIPTFLVSQLARRHVTVALSGDAGDELFGGYNRYFHGPALWCRLQRLPRPVRVGLAKVATQWSPAVIDRGIAALGRLAPGEVAGGRAGDKLHKLAGLLPARTEHEFHRTLLSCWSDPGRLVRNAEAVDDLDALSGVSDLPFAERAMLHDTLHYLPDDILTKVDRASMGVSLEARVPFLDVRVFEFAWRLPMAMKVQGGQGKRILRELLYRHVPASLIERPKQGFAVPIGRWLRGELQDWAESLLAPSRLEQEGFLYPEPIRQCWREHLSGQRNWDTRLWSVLMFQSWVESQGIVADDQMYCTGCDDIVA